MIDKFEGENAFLSNFYELSKKITDECGIAYPTVEHYFQAAKTNNISMRMAISLMDSPGKAKRAGRNLDLRYDWEEIKVNVMRQALAKKFADPVLARKLMATGNQYLEEGNHWCDNFWGVCHCSKCQDKVGQNNLGKLLMELREEIKRGDRLN